MSVQQTTGVAALARLLVRLGQGEALPVAQLVAEEDVARTTGFDIVRRLAAAQLVRRGPGGLVSAGTAATGLGFAAFGLAPLQGVAETLLALLHEQTDARVELVADGVVLVGFGRGRGEWDLDEAVGERARLRLAWRAESGRAERAQMGVAFERVRVSLEGYLGGVFGGIVPSECGAPPTPAPSPQGGGRPSQAVLVITGAEQAGEGGAEYAVDTLPLAGRDQGWGWPRTLSPRPPPPGSITDLAKG